MSEEKAKILKIKDVFDLKLSIPDYQRPYKWTIKHVQQLLDDLLTHFRNQQQVYRIGTVVIHKYNEENKETKKIEEKLDIVDGQQRLITLSLLLHSLGRENNLLNQPLTHSISKNNVINNYDFIKNYSISDTKAFKKYLLEICEIVYVELNDLDEAFQFFDSQNARGKPLESYDLLKAYHLREMRNELDEIIHQCVECWEKSAMSDDINNLDKIINYILFRLRRWHYQEYAEVFTSDELDIFKGVSKGADYPYLNVLLTGFQVNQTLFNGKCFFDYIKFYMGIYEQLFRKETGLLEQFEQIDGTNLETGLINFLDNYKNSNRVGDQYLRNLFECAILLYFDKFGNNNLSEFVAKAFFWVYRIRIEKDRISFKTIEKAAHDKYGLLYHIEKSVTPEQVIRFIAKKNEINFHNVDDKIKEICKYEIR
ncbi:DUF262 domain-containing protein [Haemophilus sputorum]|uniref:DUF262 domain-containing protein n=1 Tax=Haemophilus sputorum TaxID=1078480 RepID=UPI0021078C31|nr:DUF262 domain-containing protein [Haemophilus sputorum]MCQ1858215.1 DUF262 domain-containing protein [Haemophilus sputorum]